VKEDRPRQLYDPDDPQLRRDPYPVYERLRHHAPVYMGRLGVWVVATYADAVTTLRSPHATSVPEAWDLYPEVAEAVYGDLDCTVLRLQRTWLMLRDGDPHTEARRVVSRAFARQWLVAAESMTRPIAEQVVEGLAAAGGGDFISDVAEVVPVSLMARLFGLPDSDAFHCQRLLQRVLRTFGLGSVDSAVVAEGNDAAAEVWGYFADLVARRRRDPADDMLSYLLRSGGADVLSEDEWSANAVLLFAAGHETTVNLLGNGMLALLRHPQEYERLRARPDLVPTMVTEALRYDSPMQVISRSMTGTLRVGGFTIEPGEHVAVLLGSANRDEAQFPEAARFDIGRTDSRPLSFGVGSHYCLGARLAQIEAEQVFGLMARGPTWRLTGEELEWVPVSSHRGLVRLPVAVGDQL
jgi:cytochrome P450